MYFVRPGTDMGHDGPQPIASLPKPVGNPGAPIKMEVCVGHCFAPVLVDLHDILANWPDKVHAAFSVVHSPTGQKMLKKYGESCAAIFINGKTKFRVKRENGVRSIEFHGPPGDTYQLADLARVLRMELAKTPGGLPSDFDEKIKPLLAASGYHEPSENAEHQPASAAPAKP